MSYKFVIILTVFFFVAVPSHTQTQQQQQPDSFTCPEEFGYFPKPHDCTKYYVCVFGGALLESCTGGLEYSHELQTCDWPRNVDCFNVSTAAAAAAAGSNQQEDASLDNSVSRLGRRSYAGNVPDYRQELREERERANVIYGRLPKKRRPHRRRRKRQTQTTALASTLDQTDDYEDYYDDDNNDDYEEEEADEEEPGRQKTQQATQTWTRSLNSRPAAAATQSQQKQQQPASDYDNYYNTRYGAATYNQSSSSTTTKRPTAAAAVYEYYPDEYYEPLPPSTTTRRPATTTTTAARYDTQQYSREYVPQQQTREYVTPAAAASPAIPTAGSRTQQQQYYDTAPAAAPASDYYLYDDDVVDGSEYDVDYQQPAVAAATTTTPKPTPKSPSRGNSRHQVQQQQIQPQQNSRPTLKPSTKLLKDHTAATPRDVYLDLPSRDAPIYQQPEYNTLAKKCKRELCQVPDCNCGGKQIPTPNLNPSQIPQIIMITFDDSVNDLNKQLYSDLFKKGRTNPNGCPITATFYVSHEWTDYSQVQNLAADGHEIASHSITHSFGEQFTVKKWDKEITGQREILAAYGGVKLNEIRGMRAPFLAVGGNNMFKMLYDSNWTYDSSMPVYENNPPSWPYTLDYKLFHDCMIPPCPTKSYPGLWEVPMVMWQDLKGGRCSMADACSNPPDAEGVYQMLAKNFERHYNSNRAPFGMYYHAAWFTQQHHKEGFEHFLDALTQMPDVWILTTYQALQYVRNPVPISQLQNYEPFSCTGAATRTRPPHCNSPRVCNLWHKSGVRYLKTCQPCPEKFPWTGNTGVPRQAGL